MRYLTREMAADTTPRALVLTEPVLPEAAGSRKWRRFRSWVARTRLEEFGPTCALMNWAGEFFVWLLSKILAFEFPPGHPWPTRMLYLFGWYESESVALCQRRIRPGMTVVDLGAHNGYFTLLFSRLAGASGRVFAFEPHAPTCDLLRRNLRCARHDNVEVIQKAVADAPGVMDFFELSLAGTHSLFNVAEVDSHLALCGRLTTECVTLDEFLAARGNPRVDFVKMDIEGAEPKALRGMTRTIQRCPALMLLVEFNLHSLQAADVAPEDFLKQLTGLGFELHVVTGRGTLMPVDDRLLPAARQCPMNLFCTRRSAP